MIPGLWNGVRDERMRELKDVDTTYPYGMDFKPGGERHDRIVKMVNECAERGMGATDNCIDEYTKIDHSLDCFMSPDEMDRRRKGKDARKPINVVVPQQYANLDIFKTGMHKAFFSGKYIHRYAGKGSPERAAKAIIANEVVARIGAPDWFKHRRSLDILYGDCFSYGRGWMWGKWSKRKAPRYEITQIDEMMSAMLGEMGGDYKVGEQIRYMTDEMEVTKEGTEWVNIDPYQVLPDPTVTPDCFQDSEFFGWASRTDANILIGQEGDPEENLFNTRALPIIAQISPTSRYYRTDAPPTPRIDPGDGQWKDTINSSNIDIVYMMCRIVPRDWGLGEGKMPQLWFFAVAGDKLLIKAHQIRARHGMYPVVCGAPNARGHHIAPVSHLMVTQGLAGATDYLVKRRLDFLDTAQNGKFAIDPTLFEYRDFRDSSGGPTIVRMKKSAFGTGKIHDGFMQFDIKDVTAGTWGDVSSLIQMARDGSGIQDVLLGSGGNLPERPTATGIDALQGGALSRLTRAAIVLDEQVHATKGYQDICNVSQYMGSEMIIEIEGRDEEIVRGWYALPDGATGLSVDRWDIDPELDVVATSNVGQGAKNMAAMNEVVKSIMPAFMAQPGAVQSMVPFISQYMREVGIDDYDYISVTVAPDQMVQQAAQAGALQPMGAGAPA